MVSALYVPPLLATFAVLVAATSLKDSYCKLEDRCMKKPHTLCKYDFLKVSRQCGKVFSAELSQKEKDQILEAHNKYRARVARGEEKNGSNGPQPAARNLGPLKWDKELAGIAQTWVNQCEYRHDVCRITERFNVGQNLAKGTGAWSVSELVDSWYSEVKFFNRNMIKSFNPTYEELKKIGHYTQMIWAETTLVGCGKIHFKNGPEDNTLLACNYGPSGNFISQQIYQTR